MEGHGPGGTGLAPRRSASERFGFELRRWRKESGLSQARLGALVHVSADLIHRVEVGERRPSLRLASDSDSALGAGGALMRAWEDLQAGARQMAGADTVSAGPAGVVSERPAGHACGALARTACSARDVEAVEDFTRTFRHLDNKFGGGHAHSLAVQFFESNVAPMLREGGYTDAVGSGLLRAATHLAHLAAWTAYDVTDHDCADRYFGNAIELSVAAGDVAFGGEILAAKSHHAIHLGNAARALELARASESTAKVAATPALESEACVLEANALAVMGDASACAESLHRAEVAFDQAREGNTPEWLSYLDEGYLAARFAHCFRDLKDWHHAGTFAERAAGLGQTLTRSHAFNMTVLATTHVAGDMERACQVGKRAVDLAADLQSGRLIGYIHDLQRLMSD